MSLVHFIIQEQNLVIMKQRTILSVTAILFLTSIMSSCRSGKAEGCGHWGSVEQEEPMRVKEKSPDYQVYKRETAD